MRRTFPGRHRLAAYGHPSRGRSLSLFSQYDFFKRWIMRRIAREKGTPSDTSQDYEFTDWLALDGFVDDFLAGAGPGR